MFRKRETRKPNIYIDSSFPQDSLLDFELVIEALKKELGDDDELNLILPPTKLSKDSYEVKLKNGTTIQCQQEMTKEGLRTKTNIKLNSTEPNIKPKPEDSSNKFAKLASALVAAECTASGKKPGPEVKIYIEIRPNNPHTQKILEAMKKGLRDKGFTVLDTSPESKPSVTPPKPK